MAIRIIDVRPEDDRHGPFDLRVFKSIYDDVIRVSMFTRAEYD